MLRNDRGISKGTQSDVLTMSSTMPMVPYEFGSPPGAPTHARAAEASPPAGLQHAAVPAVHGVLQQLGQPEEQVVRMRYGIGTRMHSVDEVGEQLGLLPGQVERIESRAFRKLRDTAVVPEQSETPSTAVAPSPGDSRAPIGRAQPQVVPGDPGWEGNPWDEV